LVKRFPPFKREFPRAQTFRKVFWLFPPKVLEQRFAGWVSFLREVVRGVGVAIDGKTLSGSKKAGDGSGALHLLSAYASEAGLVIGQIAVDGKSNERRSIAAITAKRIAKKQGKHLSRRASTLHPCPLVPPRSSRPSARIGGPKTICTGSWT
jgi:hypothetical protein